MKNTDLLVNNNKENINSNKENKENKENRIWELDFARGIALLLMIYFHIIFDMKDIFGYNINYSQGINYLAGRASGILFILISGISCTLSKSNTKRAIRILFLALIITIITHLYNMELGIKFGILHFLGFSILLFSLLNYLNETLLAMLGTVILVLGGYISKIRVNFDHLFILGITSDKFISSDYYPLIPWLGIFIYGVILGKYFYKEKKSIFSFQLKGGLISYFGRNTLLIYIIHQPIILVFLKLINSIFN
jgi:uncharacterized membrane protein